MFPIGLKYHFVRGTHSNPWHPVQQARILSLLHLQDSTNRYIHRLCHLVACWKKEWDTGKNNGDFQIFVGFFLHIWKSLRTGGCVSKKFPQSSTASFNFLLSFPMSDMVLNLFLQTFSIFISVSPCFSAFVKYVKKETLHIPKMGNKIIPLKKRKMFTLKNLIKKFYFSKFQSIYSRHRRLKIKMKK